MVGQRKRKFLGLPHTWAHLGTPGQVHHSVNEALGGGGSGKAE